MGVGKGLSVRVNLLGALFPFWTVDPLGISTSEGDFFPAGCGVGKTDFPLVSLRAGTLDDGFAGGDSDKWQCI